MADVMQSWLQANLETFSFVDGDMSYVSIQPFVEKLGLDWDVERQRLGSEDHWDYREEVIQGNLVAGLPADKLFVYLKAVNVDGVRPELREPLRQYQEVSRRMTRDAFLQGDLLKYARSKANPTPLEQKLIEAAEILEREKRAEEQGGG